MDRANLERLVKLEIEDFTKEFTQKYKPWARRPEMPWDRGSTEQLIYLGMSVGKYTMSPDGTAYDPVYEDLSEIDKRRIHITELEVELESIVENELYKDRMKEIRSKIEALGYTIEEVADALDLYTHDQDEYND